MLTPKQLASSLREQDTLIDILFGPVNGANYYIDKFDSAKKFVGELALNENDATQRYTWDLHCHNRARPPELARREPHAISPDSHFSLGRAFPESVSEANDTNKE